jgi:FkbM family methyltransferase
MVMNTLFRAIFKHSSHYLAELPYNLQWAIRLNEQERDYLKQNSILVCDVGARGGAPQELSSFFPFLNYSAFDADKEECERLKSSLHPYAEYHIFPYFIGKAVSNDVFNLFRKRGQSSVFKPNKRYKTSFEGDDFAVERTCNVNTTTLDLAYSNEKINLPDILKLDTQGSELDILRNATEVLKTANLVEVEVEFVECYEGQPLFHQVIEYMMGQNFELLYLNRVLGQRKQIFKGPAKGQIIFGDALFARREDCLGGQPKERIVKYVLLLINYGHIDLAYQICQMYPAVLDELPSLNRFFRVNTYGSILKRGFFAQLDKLILLLLCLRKTNQITMDSDRSWPFR